LLGCGGSDKRPTAAPESSQAEQVIRTWTDAVRKADYATANELFARPSTILNGSRKFRLEKIDQIDAFNRSFPCGAVLKSTQEQAGDHTLATFKLVKASDGRDCRGSVGATARVSFLIDADGHIQEWFRVSTEPPPGSQQT
jgi:hypothetical protein